MIKGLSQDMNFRLEALMLKAVNQRRLILWRRIRLQREFKDVLEIDGFPWMELGKAPRVTRSLFLALTAIASRPSALDLTSNICKSIREGLSSNRPRRRSAGSGPARTCPDGIGSHLERGSGPHFCHMCPQVPREGETRVYPVLFLKETWGEMGVPYGTRTCFITIILWM
jgi:hypothetical protein